MGGEVGLQAGTVSGATSKLYTRAVLPAAILAARIFRDWGNVDTLCGYPIRPTLLSPSA